MATEITVQQQNEQKQEQEQEQQDQQEEPEEHETITVEVQDEESSDESVQNDDIRPTVKPLAQVQTLSFAQDLRHSYTSITRRMMKGSKSLRDISELLRLRIDA